MRSSPIWLRCGADMQWRYCRRLTSAAQARSSIASLRSFSIGQWRDAGDWRRASVDAAPRCIAISPCCWKPPEAPVTMTAMAYLGGNWIGSWIRYEAQVVVIAALLFMPRLRLPRQMVAVILLLAAASFHIYLVHRLVPEYFLEDLEPALSPALAAMLAIASGVGLGLATFRLQNIGLQWVRDWRETAATAFARPPEKDPTMI
jgi:hypothetical protein